MHLDNPVQCYIRLKHGYLKQGANSKRGRIFSKILQHFVTTRGHRHSSSTNSIITYSYGRNAILANASPAFDILYLFAEELREHEIKAGSYHLEHLDLVAFQQDPFTIHLIDSESQTVTLVQWDHQPIDQMCENVFAQGFIEVVYNCEKGPSTSLWDLL